MLARLWREHGDVVRMRFGGPLVGYLIVHPDGVKHVLQDHAANYGKDPWYNDKLRAVLGDGLFTSEGASWRHQRRLAQPAFHRQRIAALGVAMTEASQALADAWRRREHPSEPVDVWREMMGLTMRIVSRSLLGSEVGSDTSFIGEAIETSVDYTYGRMESYLDLPGKLPLPSTLRFRSALAQLDAIAYRVIKEKRGRPEVSGDLLSLLLSARDEETDECLSDRELRDQVMTIFLAGHETTAVALSWTWYLLSRHPEIRRRLLNELSDVLGGRVPTVDDLTQLPYLGHVVDEALRLFPPAWILSRRPIEDDEIMGYRIPARAPVFLSPYLTHRHPTFWSNPEGVDPGRFEAEVVAARPRFAYFPFGGGPRQCIGLAFASVEARLVLATIAQVFLLDLVPGHPVALDPRITLRPRYGLPMTLRQVD
jgi:cytochrome P450